MYETKHLILRNWQDSDLEPFAIMVQDPVVMEYFPTLLTKDEASLYIYQTREKIKTIGFGFYACELKATHEFIGFIGLNIPSFQADFTPCVEIGWRLAKEHWGKGYASEGALKWLDVGFDEFDLERIVSFTPKDNLRSIKVMQKIGMTKCANGEFLHPNLAKDHKLALHVLYQIDRSDFQNKII